MKERSVLRDDDVEQRQAVEQEFQFAQLPARNEDELFAAVLYALDGFDRPISHAAVASKRAVIIDCERGEQHASSSHSSANGSTPHQYKDASIR